VKPDFSGEYVLDRAASRRSATEGSWVLRPILWFAAASMLTTTLHELAHACVAFGLGVRSTLFNYSAELDLTPSQAATNLPALIRIAGPVFCLAFGMLSFFAFKGARSSRVQMPLLFFSTFGIGTFFGNLMSTAFVGDFSAVAVALRLPMPVRYAVAAVGACSVAAIHFWAGRQLARRVPSHVGRVAGTLGIIVLPVVLGTVAVILVNLPMRGTTVSARVAESSFWLFAAIGAMLTRAHAPTSRGTFELRWADAAVAFLAVVVVRLTARGIPFVP
jgi:hypothetical protein